MLYDILKDACKGLFKFGKKKHCKDTIKKNMLYICNEIANSADIKQFHEKFPTEMAILKNIKLLPTTFNVIDNDSISEYRNKIKQEIIKISAGHYDKQIIEIVKI